MQCLKLCGGSRVACVGVLIASLMGSAYGATSTWVHDPGTMGGWSDPNNWTPQPPGSSDIALIDNGGTAGILLAASMLELCAGYSSAGAVIQLADDVTTGEVYLGYEQGAIGTYALSGGALNSSNVYLGLGGEGYFNQSGGWNVVGGSVCLGYHVGARGTYILSAGRLDVPGREDIAVYGTGIFNQSGGTNAVGSIRLGYHTGSSGTYDLSGGSLATAGNQFIGYYGTGSMVQSGGTHIVAQTLYLGYNSASRGSYHLGGGLVNVAGSLRVATGTNARGTLNVSAGTLTAGGPIILSSGGSSTGLLKVGKDAYAEVGGLAANTGGGRSSTVGVELALSGHTTIHTTAASTLGGTLDVQCLSGFRPKEGEKFIVISSSDPSDVHFTGDFSVFTGNITYGLPPDSSAFGGAANGADYELVFLGYSAGDANGDHAVDGGDLALLGGTWADSITGWSNCDFNTDNIVDGGDLAMMGGNWWWLLPGAAPEAPVPEPGTLALLAVTGVAVPRRRRRCGAA